MPKTNIDLSCASETQLNNFRQSDESWDDARIILAQSNDPHMQFFAFSVYEDWIATRWRFVADDRKADLAAHLLNMAVTTGKVRQSSRQW